MKIIIVGAGAHAKVVAEILLYNKSNNIAGFTDNNKELHGKKINGFPVLGGDDILKQISATERIGVIIGIGNSNMMLRQKLFGQIQDLDCQIINAIHPSAIISHSVKLGKGIAVCAGAIINPQSQIHDNVVINTGAIIEHDNYIATNVYISPGVTTSGNVTLRENVFVGSGAVLLPGITVGKNSLIGAGAVVTKNISQNVIAYGVPAKIIKSL